jgi:hypothetical protein
MTKYRYVVWCPECVREGWDACHGGVRRPSLELFDTAEAAEQAAKEFVALVDDWRWEVEPVEVQDDPAGDADATVITAVYEDAREGAKVVSVEVAPPAASEPEST